MSAKQNYSENKTYISEKVFDNFLEVILMLYYPFLGKIGIIIFFNLQKACSLTENFHFYLIMKLESA